MPARVPAQSLQLCCWTPCNSMNCSPPDSSVHGILRQEYWSGQPFSRGSSSPRNQTSISYISCIAGTEPLGRPLRLPTDAHKALGKPVCVCKCSSLSCVRLFVTPWTVVLQAPLSVGFSRQNTGVGCHSLPQGIFPTHESNSCTAGRFFTF